MRRSDSPPTETPDPEWLRLSPHAKYVRIPHVDDWLACGWIPTSALIGSPHGEWSIYMKGLDCPCRKLPRMPKAESRT